MIPIALMRIIAGAVLSFVCLAAVPVAAQPVITRDGDAVTVRASRIATPMKIDGRLDEAVYDQVPADHRVHPAGAGAKARRSRSGPKRG